MTSSIEALGLRNALDVCVNENMFPQDDFNSWEHESEFCTSCYGFERELKVKFGDANALHHIYPAFLKFCAALPLACKIGSSALVCTVDLSFAVSKEIGIEIEPQVGHFERAERWRVKVSIHLVSDER